MDNLHRCHIVPTALCNLNHSLPEDPLHAIWECSALGIVWSSLLTFKQSVTPPPADFFNLLSRFLQIHDNNRAEFFLSVLLGPCGISETPFVLTSHPSHCTWFALLLDNFSLTIAMPKICIEWPFNLPLQINGVLWPHILSRKTLTKRSSVVPIPLVCDSLFETITVKLSGDYLCEFPSLLLLLRSKLLLAVGVFSLLWRLASMR